MSEAVLRARNLSLTDQINDAHTVLDGFKIPRFDPKDLTNREYNLSYRVKLLNEHYLKCLSDIETYYMRTQPHVD